MGDNVALNWETDKKVIGSLRDLDDALNAQRNTLFDELDQLGLGLRGSAGTSAQHFKTQVDNQIQAISQVGQAVAEALESATNQSTADDEAASEELNATVSDVDATLDVLKSGQ